VNRVAFRLSMPSVGSWNGRWSGEGRNHVIYRQMTNAQVDELFDGNASGSWFHSWDDGWGAQISARVLDTGERRAKSDGFLGYDWMVTNILQYGSPYTTGMTPSTEAEDAALEADR